MPRPTLPLANRFRALPIVNDNSYGAALLDTTGVLRVFGNSTFPNPFEVLTLSDVVDFAAHQKSTHSSDYWFEMVVNQAGYLAITATGQVFWLPTTASSYDGWSYHSQAPWQAHEVKRRTAGVEESLDAVRAQHESGNTWRVLLTSGETILISKSYAPDADTNWTASTEPATWEPKTETLAPDFRFPKYTYRNYPLPCDWKTLEVLSWTPPLLQVARDLTGSALQNIDADCYPSLHSYSATGLPAGLSVDPDGGDIIGAPTSAGNFSIQFSASDGAVTVVSPVYSVNVFAASPAVADVTLEAEIGEPFVYQLTLLNPEDAGPVTWQRGLYTTFPSWLTLDFSTGILSGTAPSAGLFNYGLRAVNSAGTGEFLFTLDVAPLSPVILPGQALGGAIGNFRSAVGLEAGTGPAASWSAVGLPSFLGISSTSGVISGNVTEDFSVTVLVTATNERGSDTKAVAVFTYQVPVVTPADLTFPAEAAVSHQFTVENPMEAGPLKWTSDDLPRGLSLNESGELSGAAAFLGEFTVTVYAVGTAGVSLARSIRIVFTEAAPRFTTPQKKLWLGIPSHFQILPENAAIVGTLSWSATGLPDWLSLAADGTLTGAPPDLTPFSFDITATGAGGSATTTVSVTTEAPPRKYILSSATTPRPHHWIRKANRQVSTFSSGLCLIQEELVCPTYLADLSIFKVGQPIADSSPCIDGAFLFPSPTVVADEDGFTTARVSYYGRWTTEPHLSAYKLKIPMSVNISIYVDTILDSSPTPNAYFLSDVIVKKFVLPRGSNIDLSPPVDELQNYSAVGARLPARNDILSVQSLFGGSFEFTGTLSENVSTTQRITLDPAKYAPLSAGDDYLPFRSNLSLVMTNCEEISYGEFTEYTVTFEPQPPTGQTASLIGRPLSFAKL